MYLKSYFQALDKNQGANIPVTDFYINSLSKINIDGTAKKELAENLNFLKDLMIYLDYDDVQENTLASWAPCAHRDCLDCCMYRKLQDLSNGNWVDKTLFVLSAATSTAEMVASSGWDCLF